MIDLRSDTVTRPSKPMRAAIARAEVGDDVLGEDPTVRTLEERVADMFGHEAALFTVTGSLANLLGVAALVPPGTEVLCEASAHIARAELGAHAAVSGVSMRTWRAPAREVGLDEIAAMVAVDPGGYLVRTSALSIENTHNFSGGAVLPFSQLRLLRDFASGARLNVHLDGARIWNAHVASGVSLRDYGAVADVMSVCLSKGLGAPAGSLLVGPQALLDEARVRRKRLGGGWRQAGLIAAAGSHALDHQVHRLAEDHERARLIAQACGVDPSLVDTNIVIVPTSDSATLVRSAREAGVLVGALGPRAVRVVTHLDVSHSQAVSAAAILGRILSPS